MFKREIEIGKKAVLTAMRISCIIQRELTSGDLILKSDKSPVTIADFTSQAIICKMLKENFPDIPIVAEESSKELKRAKNKKILNKIFQYIEGDQEVNQILNRENLFKSIDLGNLSIAEKFWTLDPVDGTKGFLRGEQFAIALAMVVKGEVKLGILGCPNLKLSDNISNRGYIFSAVRNRGVELLNLETNKVKKIVVSNISSFEKMRFVQSYESSHSNKNLQLKIAGVLKMERKPVEMDSQAKYGVVASGEAEIYIRIPHPETPLYKEKIWDHAAGSIIVEESGGVVSDIFGKKLDFNAGATLKNNTGILVSVPSVHKKLLNILKEVCLN